MVQGTGTGRRLTVDRVSVDKGIRYPDEEDHLRVSVDLKAVGWTIEEAGTLTDLVLMALKGARTDDRPQR